MSDINGTGHGSSHNWLYLGSRPGISTYKCSVCGHLFYHHYHDIDNIFKAMKVSGVPEACVSVKEGKP